MQKLEMLYKIKRKKLENISFETFQFGFFLLFVCSRFQNTPTCVLFSNLNFVIFIYENIFFYFRKTKWANLINSAFQNKT